MKGQALANFIAKYTQSEGQGVDGLKQRIIHTDGFSNWHAGGAGVVIQTLERDKIECMIQLDFLMTNNKAEYEALVAGLDLTKAARAGNLIVRCDS